MSFCRKTPVLLALCLAAVLPLTLRAEEPPKKPVTLEDLQLEIRQWRLEQVMTAQAQDVANKLLKDEIARLEQRIAALELKPQVRTSFSPPQAVGTIRLENRLGMASTILINDVPYRLQPFQTREIQGQPAGTFTFEVLVDGFASLQPKATRNLLQNQVYTIFTYQP